MRIIKKKLSRDFKNIEIIPLADWHIGDKFCDIENIRKTLDYIKENDNVFCVLNGDLANNATKTSISDSYAENYSPDEQIDMLVSLLKPIKDKILAITSGNHEKRTYKKEGIDLTKVVARQLNLLDSYDNVSCVLFLSIGKDLQHTTTKRQAQQNYVIYLTHGSGGGRKEGAKAIRLADMASIIDADIYIHSHTHLPMIIKEEYFRTDNINKTVIPVTKLFVNTASSLKYGGYGEEYEYKPGTIHNPSIYLDGTKKYAKANL